MNSGINIIVGGFQTQGFPAFLGQWLLYVMLVALIGTWVAQMIWINEGLVHCPAIFIISLEAVFNEIMGVLGGLLYFQEYNNFGTVDLAVFCVGVALSLVGVSIIATRPQETKLHD